jgi:peptidylprolyl isomerase
MKALIIGIISTVVLAGIIGGAIYMASRGEPEEAATTPATDKTVPLTEAQADQPTIQKLAGTKLADFEPRSEPVTELEIIDLVKGDGAEVQAGASVTAHYTGALVADGTIFQSSHDGGAAVDFSLDAVIKGWQEGVPGMKVGGKRRLIIPAEMAYGLNPPPGSGIPPGADLVFDIELVAIP